MGSKVNVAFLAATLLLAGCAAKEISLVSAMVTSKEKLDLDKPAQQLSFGLDEIVVVEVYLTWPDVTASGGTHKVEWNWYRNDQLVSHGHALLRFNFSPCNLHTDRAASSLGAGNFRVETVVDGKVLDTRTFTIKA